MIIITDQDHTKEIITHMKDTIAAMIIEVIIAAIIGLVGLIIEKNNIIGLKNIRE